MKTDWHIHTNASDGVYSPLEIVQLASQAGISQMAISDHDTLASWQKIISVAEELPSMYLIPAVEFGVDISSGSEEDEVHILGYGIDPFSEELHSYLNRLQDTRKNRFSLLLNKAREAGCPISEEAVASVLVEGTLPGRLHLARLLVQEGFFPTIAEAFDKFLSPGRPGYVPRFRYRLEETYGLIQRSGGIAVLAHPYEIESVILRDSLLKSDFIDGVEAFHPSHGDEESKVLLEICKRDKKYATGGSDFHGVAGRFPEKLGIFTPPSEMIQEFIEWANQSPCGVKIG